MITPLSDVHGRIEHVFFALPAIDAEYTGALLSCFHGIRVALGRGVRCTVLHHAEHVSAVEDALADLGELDLIAWKQGLVLRLRDTAAHVEGGTLRITKASNPDFTTWVQDGFLVAGHRIWASPRVKRTYGGWDDEVVRQLAAHLGWPIELLPCGVEAGNVLTDENDVVIGADVQRHSKDDEWNALIAQLGQGRRVHVCAADQAQPIFHLDLYVTLAGTHALVGSVEQGRACVGEPYTDADRAMDEGLQAAVLSLMNAGYQVERLPLLPFRHHYMEKDGYFTHNNCLVEVAAGMRRVVLPAYGSDANDPLAALDRASARVWQRLGFEVVFAHGAFATVSELLGGLRCMTKVLARA